MLQPETRHFAMAQDGKEKLSDDKFVETMKFLLTSVKKLSDTFVESEGKAKQDFDVVSTQVQELSRRLAWLERVIEERRAVPEAPRPDSVDVASGSRGAKLAADEIQLPLVPGTEEFRVPVLNLPMETVVEVYANTPVLLAPFSRPCSLTGRTLSGEIGSVELEVFAQGSTWVVETQPGGWLLIPRPGSLERKTSLQSLERLFEIEGVKLLPVLLHLIRPAQLDAVEVGHRWQLRDKGMLSVSPDPLKVGITERLLRLEQRLEQLERQQTA